MQQDSQPMALSEPATDLSAWSLSDRQRLEAQFGLLRDDFNLWFDRALRHGGLVTDPARAAWRALDAGCGRGQYTREIAARYPGSTVVGFDADPESIADAARAGAARPRFHVHDATRPLPAAAVPDGGFDVVVAWLVLMWVPDKAAMLRELATVMRPGGVLLLANMPDDWFQHSHPALARMLGAGAEALRLAGAGLQGQLDVHLREAGFEAITTVRPRFPIGGATAWGRRWWVHWLRTLVAARRAVVDVHGLMDGDEFDRTAELLASQSMIDHDGHFDHLYTVARRIGPEHGARLH
jgi:SAM-dependent methyltransferase